MIQRKETINISLTPREIESEIWNMDSEEQAERGRCVPFKKATRIKLTELLEIVENMEKEIKNDT